MILSLAISLKLELPVKETVNGKRKRCGSSGRLKLSGITGWSKMATWSMLFIALDTAAGSVGSSLVAIVGRLDVGASSDWLE